MRCTQLFGLTDLARAYISENVRTIPCNPCPHCGEHTSSELDMIVYEDATNYGMFDDGPMLHRYNLKVGGYVEEYVQNVVHSSGPCIFLALRDEKGITFCKWSEEAIRNA